MATYAKANKKAYASNQTHTLFFHGIGRRSYFIASIALMTSCA